MIQIIISLRPVARYILIIWVLTIITLFIILFALFDETHQIWIPGRAFNYRDIIGNFTGIIAGIIFCVVVFRKIALTVRNNPK